MTDPDAGSWPASAAPGGAARWRPVVVAGATAYGFGVELLQVPLPYREFALADVLADAVGATLSLGWLAVEHYVSE